MTLDNDIDTNINLRSDYRDSSINDSVFFSSSISIDVICLVAVIIVLLLTIEFFLRLSKRIIVLEHEIVVIWRALKGSRVFSEESQCWEDWKSRISHLLEPTRKIFKSWNLIYFFSIIARSGFSHSCWLDSQILSCKQCSHTLSDEIWVKSWLHLVRKRTCVSNTNSSVNTVV